MGATFESLHKRTSPYEKPENYENNIKFKSLLRMEVSENGIVEIYSESEEAVSEIYTNGEYFGSQWRNFEEKVKLRQKQTRIYSSL